MQSLSTTARPGLALTRPVGQTRHSMKSKNFKLALPHAKGSHENAGIDITSVSLALLMTFSASPAFAESDSYEDMLKKFKSKQADTVKQYEKAAKTSSNLIASPTAPVSDKLPFSSFFGDKKEPASAPAVSDNVKPLSSFAAPKMEAPKMPDLPKMNFSAPKFDMPKVSDMPKMDIPKFEAPSLPSAPSSPAPPVVVKKVEPPPPPAAAPVVPKPVVRAPTPPPVVVKPYVAPSPAPVAPTPAPAVRAPAASSQGDYMDRWQRDQVKTGSATKAVTTPSQRSAVPAKKAVKEAPKKNAGKRKGPLPLFLAEFFMLALIGGFGFAVLFLQDALKGAYVAADKAIASATANFNKRSD